LPVGYGYSGPQGMRLAAQEADEWYPEDVPVTMFCWGWESVQPSIENLKEYADLGVERIVVCPPTMQRHGPDVTLRRLDEFMPLV
jgi:hypothetical protein